MLSLNYRCSPCRCRDSPPEAPESTTRSLDSLLGVASGCARFRQSRKESAKWSKLSVGVSDRARATRIELQDRHVIPWSCCLISMKFTLFISQLVSFMKSSFKRVILYVQRLEGNGAQVCACHGGDSEDAVQDVYIQPVRAHECGPLTISSIVRMPVMVNFRHSL